ncbi:MAG TPA: RIP metalloprotease RseP [Gemmatimonadales bacterium]|nr:RIP metalloprotease RseP [Gemmatimonadales bacterium]
MSNLVITVLSLVVVLGVLVFVHELGHFLAAKWAGIRVFRFSLGMGAPIKALTFHRGGTEYTVSWLPLGGYVKMASAEEMAGDMLEGGRPEGMEVPREETFESKPVWKRMVVILAGVVMNVLFAWLILSGVFLKNGRAVTLTTTVGRVIDSALAPEAKALGTLQAGDRITAIDGKPVDSWDAMMRGIQSGAADSIVVALDGKPAIVLPLHRDDLTQRITASGALLPLLPPIAGDVVKGRPADQAGLQKGDTIITVEDQPVSQWYDMVGLLENRAGVATRFEIGRADGRHQLTITPYEDKIRSRTIGRIGVYPSPLPVRHEPLGIGAALAAGGAATFETSTFIFRTVRGMLSGRVSTNEVGGPIAIGQAAGESARAGIDSFLGFMALISVNLAVVNLLPIPVLDGGQFLFLLGEAVLRRPLPLKLRQRLTAVGLVLILLLMALAFSNDIRRIFGLL